MPALHLFFLRVTPLWRGGEKGQETVRDKGGAKNFF